MKDWLKKFFLKWGFYSVLLFCLLLAAAAMFFMWYLQVPPIRVEPDALLGPKLTFLSVIIALLMFQYDHFYRESGALKDRIAKRDFGPGWPAHINWVDQARWYLNAVQQMDPTVQPIPDIIGLRTQLEESERNIQRVEREFRDTLHRLLIGFSLRLGLMFSIGLLTFASVVLDVTSLIRDELRCWTDFYSQATFLTAILMMLFLIVALIAIIHRNFWYFRQQ